jgi:hypothetical protein
MAIIFIIFTACKKETEESRNIPMEVGGQWVRGSFDLSGFWNYDGSQVQPAATTDGLEIKPDGTLLQYLVYFPTDAQQGCKPQKLMYRKGTIEFKPADSSFMIRYKEGHYKEFYQHCIGKENIDRVLPSDSLSGITLTGFYKVIESDGKKLMGISYVGTGGPYLFLEKKNFKN